MEHSTKMTLVPVDEANLTQLSELDSDLTNILKNKELTQEDKIKLYQTMLGKYKKYEEKTFPEVENVKIKHREAKASIRNHPKRNYLKKKKIEQVKKAQSKSNGQHFNYFFFVIV